MESIDLVATEAADSPIGLNTRVRLTSLAGDAAGATKFQNMLDEKQLYVV